MIRGRVVDAREVVLPVRVTSPTGSIDIDAVLDTGFTEFLTLPQSQIDALQLRWRYLEPMELADGSVGHFNIYDGEVEWDGKIRLIVVLSAEGAPLLGMQMLQGHRLTADTLRDGVVTIEALRADD